MSNSGISSTLLNLFQSSQTGNTAKSTLSAGGLLGSSESVDFSSSLALRMATLQAQSVTSLIGSVFSGGSTSSAFDFLNGMTGTQSDSTAHQGLSATGRNLSLFDPESAYTMMSVINNNDVTYKAQFSELSEMKTAVATMQQAGQTLGSVNESMDNEAIKSQLQAFAVKYNEWINRFDGTVKSGGLLDGTQAAEISLYELEQSVENSFNGAKTGFHGLRDLGFTIDENTNLASIDTTRLDAALASNKDGAISTLQEFSANFSKSAELLNSANNFIPNRLDNLDRVIDYITDNKTSLQAEFGLGDPAKPSAQVTKALAAYNRIYGI
jgi:hypothetical protein